METKRYFNKYILMSPGFLDVVLKKWLWSLSYAYLVRPLKQGKVIICLTNCTKCEVCKKLFTVTVTLE